MPNSDKSIQDEILTALSIKCFLFATWYIRGINISVNDVISMCNAWNAWNA